MDLTQQRDDVADILTAAGINGAVYTAEDITPPCAAVVPAQPYLRWSVEGMTFGQPVKVRYEVLLLSHLAEAKTTAERIDDLIVTALTALLANDDYDVTEVSQPGVVDISGSKFMGSVITIEHETEEP